MAVANAVPAALSDVDRGREGENPIRVSRLRNTNSRVFHVGTVIKTRIAPGCSNPGRKARVTRASIDASQVFGEKFMQHWDTHVMVLQGAALKPLNVDCSMKQQFVGGSTLNHVVWTESYSNPPPPRSSHGNDACPQHCCNVRLLNSV